MSDLNATIIQDTLNYKEIPTKKRVLHFINIKIDSKKWDRLMLSQDKILDLSRIFRNLSLDILAIELLVFHYL